MNKYYNDENEENPSLFETYGDDEEFNATINYHRKVFYQKSPEDPLKELYLYNFELPDDEKFEIAVPKVRYEEEPRKHLPKWIRKEIKQDKRAWKQIHQTLKHTPKYAPEYFTPLPKVEKAVVNYDKYEKYLHPQNNEDDQFRNNSENSKSQLNEENSNSQTSE